MQEKVPTFHEELAMVKGAQFGVDDRDRVSLRFEVQILYGAALQVIHDWIQIQEIFKSSEASDVKYLNNKPCVVSVEDSPGMATVKFLRML